MEVQLVVKKGKTSVESLRLKKFPTYVGRSQECNLRIAARQVSRRHCCLKWREGWLSVSDMGSCNGTVVNGRVIRSEVTLYPGDVLEIGPVMFQIDYAAPSSPLGTQPNSDTLVAMTATDETPTLRESAYELSDRIAELERAKELDSLDTHKPGEQIFGSADSGSKIIVLDETNESGMSPTRRLFASDIVGRNKTSPS